MKKIVKTGSVDQTLDVFISDSASTTGAGKTGLVFNTASLVCYYRTGATGTATALALVTQTVGGAHSDGGFVEIDATNMPGMYRLDLSDTIVAAAGSVSMMLKGAAGMAPLTIELQVTAADLEGGVVPTVSAVTGLTAANLDTTVSSRMATYTQPAGFLAATFPAGTVANTTNITAATGIVLSGVTHTGAVIPTVSAVTGLTAATVHADLDDIQARLPAALVGGRIDASVGAVAANAITAASIAPDAGVELRGVVTGTADSGTTTTVVDAERTEADTDYWRGQMIVFTSGTLLGQARLITAFNAATDTITYSPATTVAAGTHTYEIRPASDAILAQLTHTGAVVPTVTAVTNGVTVAAGGIISGAHAAAELNTIADAVLDRNMATGTDSGTDTTAVRTPRQSLRSLRNKAAIAAGTLTVYKEDDVTASFTAAIATTAGNPVSSVDPT